MKNKCVNVIYIYIYIYLHDILYIYNIIIYIYMHIFKLNMYGTWFDINDSFNCQRRLMTGQMKLHCRAEQLIRDLCFI